jgi:acyl-CoA synthetase (NDP forming)
VSGDDIANVLAAVGEQSDKPLVSSFLGAEGVPELLRVPDVAGSTAGRGSVPSYSSVESAVRALARVVEYAVWLRTPDGPQADSESVDRERAKRVVNQVLAARPAGGALGRDELGELLASYGVRLWPTLPVTSLEEAQEAGRRLEWDVVLKATADHLRERPDMAHVWRNISDDHEMEEAWRGLTAFIGDVDAAGFVVQKVAGPGVPLMIRSIEDPLFGPVVSFGLGGPMSELLGDRSYRIPPLSRRDAAAMVREVKAAPMLFGYRGAEVVDVEEVERLIRRVAQLQNDLPQVSALTLDLVLAGPDGAHVLTANGRIEPVLDPRSDWFVRRMPALPGDTIPS